MNRNLKIFCTLASVAIGTTLFMGDQSGCDGNSTVPTADQHNSEVQNNTLAEADRQVGMPAISNWTEKKLVKQNYELRDNPNLVTWTYMQGLDGKLICLGKSIGYGIPYAVQFSNPEHLVHADLGQYYGQTALPQAEPNGLFPPTSTAGTWVQMLNPETKEVSSVYIEPNVTVFPFRYKGPALAVDCALDKVEDADKSK